MEPLLNITESFNLSTILTGEVAVGYNLFFEFIAAFAGLSIFIYYLFKIEPFSKLVARYHYEVCLFKDYPNNSNINIHIVKYVYKPFYLLVVIMLGITMFCTASLCAFFVISGIHSFFILTPGFNNFIAFTSAAGLTVALIIYLNMYTHVFKYYVRAYSNS